MHSAATNDFVISDTFAPNHGAITAAPSGSVSVDRLLRRITRCTLQSLALSEIFQIAIAEVQQFLAVDRVMLYQFQPDQSGQVIAESRSVSERLPSLQGLYFPADDIPDAARELFIAAKVRNVVDVASGQISQSRLYDPDSGEIIPADWIMRPLDPCHQMYLTAMGVKSSLTVPVFYQDQLWGLLVVHHAQPREIPFDQLTGVQLVVDQLGIAISQSHYIQQAQKKAERKIVANQITAHLASHMEFDLPSTLAIIVEAIGGSGGRLTLDPEALKIAIGMTEPLSLSALTYTYGNQPVMTHNHLPLLEQSHILASHFESTGDRLWAIDDVYQVSDLRVLQPTFQATGIRSVLIVPMTIHVHRIGYLSIFRNELTTERLWAGECDPDQRQTMPRQSFDIWRQSKTGQVKPWLIDDQKFAILAAEKIVPAIHQYELHQQVYRLNHRLENQIHERTFALQQSIGQQQMLFDVVTKMRQSLDLDQILGTVTQEVRRLLQADRVGIYAFDPARNFNDGVFVAEAVLPEFPAAMSVPVHDHCFGEEYAPFYQQGRVSALADIQQAGLQDCYREVLEQFHIKASLVAPILKGDQLWGLFCVHHCQKAYQWQSAEIDFVQQVAAQVSIALEQADLLQQKQQHAEQLATTVETLKQVQLQLIQTEKMSSLGQLVAGVAHEVNNPINFIHGNLKHVSNYAQSLLSLAKIVQARYAETDSEIQELIEEIDLDFVYADLQKLLTSMNHGTQRIQEIVSSLKNFSRLDQAAMKSVDIHEGLESTLLILQHRLKTDKTGKSPEIKVIKQYGELPLVECYVSQLNQVFMNLISNAIDAVHQRSAEDESITPTITIMTEPCDNGSIAIHISDNGLGMEATVQGKIFDPFYTTKPVGQGTGLGLSISYQIIHERHHGLLRCASQPGQGCTFTIEIPMIGKTEAETNLVLNPAQSHPFARRLA